LDFRARIIQVMEPVGIDYCPRPHKGVDHGYALPERDVYAGHAAASIGKIFLPCYAGGWIHFIKGAVGAGPPSKVGPSKPPD